MSIERDATAADSRGNSAQITSEMIDAGEAVFFDLCPEALEKLPPTLTVRELVGRIIFASFAHRG